MRELTFTVINHEEYGDFQGPLDAILMLLSRDKIEIQDISLTRLVAQYLGMLTQWEALDMEIATEFTVMASHLVYLKTRMLLKVGEQRDEEVDSLLQALEARQRAEQYEAIKQAADWLAGQTTGFDYITKPPSPLENKAYQDVHDIADLSQAYLSLFDRPDFERMAADNLSGLVGREYHPIDIEMDNIVTRLTKGKRVHFLDLLQECGTRSRRVAVFLALLALCKDTKIVPRDSEKGLYFTAA
ncbi:MAG: segregation/condensation protein A [Oscillospiraceae bacterium]|nr:segregation/condensation protein A [Oscillospiraceae bacterium]